MPPASGATATQSAPAHGLARRVVRDDDSLDRGAIDDDTGDHRRALDAGGAEPPETTTTVKPAAPTVSISVNGSDSHVARGGTFPSSTPVFRLVSWTKGAARIGIVGGSYSTGDPTLELTIDKPVTLQNTSNGQRYKLVLLSTP